jgi:hypothetical protein
MVGQPLERWGAVFLVPACVGFAGPSACVKAGQGKTNFASVTRHDGNSPLITVPVRAAFRRVFEIILDSITCQRIVRLRLQLSSGTSWGSQSNLGVFSAVARSSR